MKHITKSGVKQIIPGKKSAALRMLFETRGIPFLFLFLITVPYATAQSGNCDPNTPFFAADLSADPNGSWTSNPPVQRNGNCCGTLAPDKCIEFKITLNAGAVAINFEIASGAIPPGAMYYQINCGPAVQVGSMICVSGVGPHTLTFCKPGNNQNTYRITSIGGPSVSPEQTTGDGCSTQAWINGVNESSITWREITSGTNAFSSYLNCTSGCDTVTVTPQAGHPPFVDYIVCGTPSAQCYPSPTFCDTIRINFLSPIQNTILPNPPSYCVNTSGITLTGNINGGLAPYLINWTNSSGVVVGTSNNYFASAPGTYSMIVYDATYPRCPAKTTSTNVTVHPVPVVNAGPDTTVCATNASVSLSGLVSNASGGVWNSSGSGVFSPSATALNATYTASAADIASGSVILTLTSTGNGSCLAVTDQMKITIAPQIFVNIPLPVVCYGEPGALTANASGGQAPYTFAWNTGSASQTINNVFPGNYNVTVTDAIPHGCQATLAVTVTQNPQINITTPFNSLISCDTSVTISVSASGGTGTLNYLWNTGAATTSINVPGGIYIVTVTDANSCTKKDTIAVNAANSVLAASVNHPANLCYGATTTLQAGATGGFGNYTFSWNNNATGSSITAGAGTYCVIVKDDQGCLNQVCVTVTQSSLLSVSIPVPSTICNGSTTSVHANVSGGLTPYNYLWNTGEATSSISKPAGSYSVTVTDSNYPACPATASVNISQASPLSVTGTTNMVSCNGGSNGTATANATGSVGPYNYMWPYNAATTATNFGLAAGTYAVNVTDAIGCAQSIGLSVSQPSPLAVSVAGTTNVSCYGGTNGSATVSPSGGMAGYSYIWSPYGGASTSATGLNAGTYTITVTDSKGCVAAANATINQPNQLTGAVAGLTNVSCYGGSNGNAEVAAAGGAGNYSYYWNETGGSSAIENSLGAGTYNVTITDASGCTANTHVVITSPPALIGNVANASAVSCYGGADGSATISASGGTPGYNFSWPSQNFYGAAISSLSAGTYAYTVTDANNCSFTNSITVSQPAQLVVASSSFTNASCKGLCNGAAEIAASGGTSPYSYQWNSGQATAGIFSICAGSYTATITDNHNCTTNASFTITEPTLLNPVITAQAANCSHEDGSATVNVTGGTQGYSYSWNTSPVQTTATAANIAPGNYTVTVTDSKSCVKTATVTIANTAGVSITSESFTNTSCSYTCDGVAAISANGGTGPYSYTWDTSPQQNTSTATGLCPGNFSVIINDVHNCRDTASFIISAPAAVMVSPTAGNAAICSGDATTLTATASGGTGNFSYSWNNGAFIGQNYLVTPSANTTYSVIASDASGCLSAVQMVSIAVHPVPFVNAGTNVTVCASSPVVQMNGSVTNATGGIWSGGNGSFFPTPASLSASYNPSAAEIANGLVTLTLTSTGNGACAAVTDQVTIGIAPQFSVNVNDALVCFGQNGSLTADVTGGSAPYTYAWSNSGTTQTISNSSPGSYSVIVKDAIQNGCSASASASIMENPQLFITVPHHVTSCNTTGNITASGNGGNGTLNYLWNTGANTPSISVPMGNYTVTVSDASGCSAQGNTTVNAVIALLNASTNQPANLCYNATTLLSANASGGFGFYTYLWNTGATTNSIAGGAGNYFVVATDSAGCKDTASVTVTQSATLAVSITNPAVICNGAFATLSVDVNGGQAPYTFMWNTGQVTSSITKPAGTYTVTVTDSNSPACSTSASRTIIEASPLTVSGSSTPVSCYGGNDGSAIISASGSIAPYHYSWTAPGANTRAITNLAAGTYSASITDSIGCAQAITVSITQPLQITSNIDLVSNVSCYGGNNGNVSVSVSGGTPGYFYNWIPGSGSGSSRSGLPAGSYTVMISDAKGCTHSDSIAITQPSQLIVSATNISHVSCFGGSNGSASVAASGGTGAYTHYWTPPGATTPSVSGLSSGAYSVIVTDSLGCTSYASITITQPQQLAATTAALSPVSCSGGTNGSATINGSGGTPGYTCYWPSMNSYNFTASSLPAGTYNYSITDLNGCTYSSGITITQPSPIVFNAVSGFDAACYQACNGAAVVVPSGGTVPYAFHWSNGQSAASINNLCAGTYSVTLTDNNGCRKDTSVVIGQPSPVTITTTSTAANCFHADGTATANASGGTPGYSYSWNTTPSQLNNNATALPPGSYIVTATDNHGCRGRDTITVANQPGVVATILNSGNTSCSNICNGQLTAGGTGGTGPFSYSWNTSPVQSGAAASSLCPGTYAVTVTDFHNCVSTASAVVTAPPPVVLATLPSSTVICNGQSTTLSAAATGGTGNYTYSWNNGAYTGQTYLVTPSSTTVYNVVAIDSNNCMSDPQSIAVTINPALIATVAPSLTVCPGATVNMTVSASGGNGNYTYRWFPGNYSGTLYSQVPPASMIYSVVVTDGCSSDTGFVNVIVNPLPAINFSADVTSGCAPLCINFVNTTTVSSGDAIVAWNWNFGDNDSSSLITPQHCFKQSGTFDVSLVAETVLGCTTSYTFSDFVLVKPSPVAAFSYSPALATATNSSIYFTETATGEHTWLWDFGDGNDSCLQENPVHLYSQEGNYCVVLTVANEYNCKDTAVHCLEIQPEFTFYIPNAFTPNGNGKNEFFTGVGENIKEYQMIIFDRWGNLIFETHDLSVPWDGKVKGGKEIVEEDVYVYKVSLLDIFDEKHEYTGHVTVLK